MRLFGVLLSAFFLTVSAPLPARAEQEITVSAQVSKTEVKPDETFVYAVTIAGSLQGSPKLHLAAFEGFRVVSTGQSQQVQIAAGKTRQALVLNYTLAPTAPGTYRIGPVTVEVDGQKIETQPIEVKVVEPDLSEELPKLEGGITL